MGLGVNVPQVGPYFYNELKIENPGIIFLSVQFMAPLGALFFGFLSDRTLNIRPFIIIKSLFTGALTIGIAFFSPEMAYKTEILAVFWGIYGFFLGGILPLMNVSFMQSGLDPFMFGRTRLFGTVGFMVINIIFMPFDIPRKYMLIAAGVLFMVSILPVFFLPKGRNTLEKSEHGVIRFIDIIYLLKMPGFIIFLMVMFLFYFQFSPAEYIISEYIDRFSFATVIPEFHIETLPAVWFLGTFIEIGFFFISPWLIQKYGVYVTISFSFIAGVIRHASLGIFPLGLGIVMMQMLHGVHFSPAYLGSILFMEKNISPFRLATGQALTLIVARGFGAGIGGFILGNIAGSGDFQTVFLYSTVASLLGLLLIVFLPFILRKYPVQ